MNRKNIFGRKAVVASLFSVMVLCSASAIVPTINGNIINREIISPTIHKRESSLLGINSIMQNSEDISYEEMFSMVENELLKENKIMLLNLLYKIDRIVKEQFGDLLPDIFPIVFKHIQNSVGPLDLAKPKAPVNFQKKMNLLRKEMQDVGIADIEEKNTDKISPSAITLISEIKEVFSDHNDKLSNQLNTGFGSEDFSWWWDMYLKLRRNMKTDGYDNYEEWFWYAHNWSTIGWMFSPVGFGFLLAAGVAILGYGPYQNIPGVALVAFFISTMSFALYASKAVLFIQTKELFDSLWTKQIDIILRIKNKQGDYLNNVAISAYNIEVPDAYESEFNDPWEAKFNYTINRARDVQEPGWYALSSIESPFYRPQPPFPPGFWEITIPNQEINKIPYGSQTIFTGEIHHSGLYINETIVLVRDWSEYPTISAPKPDDNAVKVELNTNLSVYVADPQGNAMDIFFYTNVTGDWEEICKFSPFDNGTCNCNTAEMGIFNEYNTTYYWSVTADDRFGHTNTSIFNFSTKPEKS